MPIDDPNVVLPLAISYNERGVAGYTHTVTNGEDQRKVNCLYEVSKNSLTGKGTLTLSKRPGLSNDGNTYGSSSQVAYLAVDYEPGNTPTNATGIIVTLGTKIISSASPFHDSTVLDPKLNFLPAYIDRTSISNVKNIILQLYDANADTQKAYFITEGDFSVGNPWTLISDADFTTPIKRGKIEHLDGFAFVLDRTNLIWNSDTNSLANWTSSSFLAKSIQQDSAVGLARLGTKIIAFGRESAEIFYNAGNTSGSPLGRISSIANNVGLVITASSGGTHYYSTIGNKIYFVGKQSGHRTSPGFYSFDGQSFDKVSSPYIDKILAEENLAIYSVNTVGFLGQLSVSVCFTASATATQKWLMYFPSWNEWFEWNSTIFSPVNSSGHHLGIVSPDKLFVVTGADIWQDDGTSYQWLTQFRLPTNGSSLKRMVFYGVDADTDTSASTISVDVSDDDCQSFKSLQPIDLTWERKINFRGGSYTRRHIRLSATDARPKRIANFIANVLD